MVYPATCGVAGLLVVIGLIYAGMTASGATDTLLVCGGLGALGALLVGLGFLQHRAKWSKTCLRFGEDRVVFETGGLGYKSATELVLRNITHLSYLLPIVESRVLGSGTVTVESAGSSAAEVQLAHVHDPKAVFARIQQLMARGGIELEPRQMLADEKPALHGVVLSSLWQALVIVVCVPIFFAEEIVSLSKQGPGAILAACGVAGLFLAGMGLYFIGVLIDARRQRCTLHDTSVKFEGGFPERATIIPIHNIADSDVIQGAVDRLLDLWTVNVSCQGARNEIKLTNLPGGQRFAEALTEHLRKLKQAAAVRSVMGDPVAAAAAPGAPAAAVPGVRPRLDLDRKFEASYKMTLLKNLFWPVVGAVFFACLAVLVVVFDGFKSKDGGEGFFWMGLLAVMNVAGAVRRFFEVFNTVYQVGADDLTETYKFISTKTKRFSFDKVTAMTVARGPVDWLMGTVTVKFYSIGSATAITFKSIPWEEELESKLAAKIGIQPQDPAIVLPSRFSMMDMCKGKPGYTVLLALLIACVAACAVAGAPMVPVVIGAVVVAGLCLSHPYLLARTSKLNCLDHSLLFERGILVRERTHVAYDNIKGVTATQYPFSTNGELKIDIAGEAVPEGVQQQQVEGAPQNALALQANSFTATFVESVMAEAFFVDCVQIDRPPRSQFQELRALAHAQGRPKPVLEASPHHARLLLPYLVVAALAILFGGVGLVAAGGSLLLGGCVAALVLLMLGGHAAHLATYRYVIEHGAVTFYKGLFAKSRFSITFDQIDFINVTQSIVDRGFGTGNVLVQTSGSSKAEMTLSAFRDHETFAQELTKHYKGYAPGVAAAGMNAAAS